MSEKEFWLKIMNEKEFWKNMFCSMSFNISFNWAMHALLSSYMIVDFIFSEDKPQVCHICWIIYLNQTHSRLASCNAKIFAWIDDVVFIVCFTDRYEITLPPHVNKYPVCDWPLWRSENNLYLHNPLDMILNHLGKLIFIVPLR